LLNGIEIHEAHAKLIAYAAGIEGGMGIEGVVALMRERYSTQVDAKGVYGAQEWVAHLKTEQMALLEAMLRTFERKQLPAILHEYDVVCIEKPMDWQMAPGLYQKLRFDVVLRRKADGRLIIMDFKSMAYISEAWALKLERSRQTSLYIAAAQELFGETVEMCYLGMAKGQWRTDTAKSSPFYQQKIQASPYLYAYALKGEAGTVYKPEYTSAKGYQKVRTYEEMPVVEWVDWLFANRALMLNELFVFNPPIAPTLKQMQDVRELVVYEELEYVANVRAYHEMKRKALATGNDVLLAKAEQFLDLVAAPKDEESCFKYGADSRCMFHDDVCFNEGGLENALIDGAFVPREAHHSTELESELEEAA
jgi:hypothetical protein